jgi:hypothetical protein
MKETKFIKSYKLFVKENLDIPDFEENDIDLEDGEMDLNSSDLPEDVLKSVEKILLGNFDYVDTPIISGDEITFVVSDNDGRLEPEKELTLDLGWGAMKKRPHLVTLIFVDKEKIEDGYQLTYSIKYEINTMTGERPKNKEFVDEYEEEEKLRRKEDIDLDPTKPTKHLKDLDTFFTDSPIQED